MKTLFQLLIFTLLNLLLTMGSLFSQSISGNLNATGSMNLSYANVDIYKGDKLVANVLTDVNGNYKVYLDTGTYRIEFNYAGFEKESHMIKVNKDEEVTKSLREDKKSEYYKSATERKNKSDELKLSFAPTMSKTIESVGLSESYSYDSYDRSYSYEEAPLESFSVELSDVISSSAIKSISRGLGESIGNSENIEVRSGLLTAGEINDFSKWELWNDLTNGELNEYQTIWNIGPKSRYSVQITSKNRQPLENMKVELLNPKGKIIYSALTDNTGKAELWGDLSLDSISEKCSLKIKGRGQELIAKNAKTFDQGINTFQFETDCAQNFDIDIAFVVDATGSMSDELNFLKAELNEVIYQSKSIDQRLNFRFANVFYRDHGEDYLTKKHNFSRILSESISFISDQYAGGGGDFPEAVDDALDIAMNNLDWDPNARARLMFLILDAPPHNNPEIQRKIKYQIQKASEMGIRIIPLVASGISKDAEYLLRCMALGTNGTYAFLTDHSGIGGSHLKPSTDEYEVELLSDLLVRIITNFTYQPSCEEEVPELIMDYPDSVVSYIPEDEIDSTALTEDSLSDASNDLQVTWRYWPNPTDGIVNIQVDRDVQELFITDMSGKLLFRLENLIKDRISQVDLSAFSTGIYLIRYPIGKQWISGKIILVRN